MPRYQIGPKSRLNLELTEAVRGRLEDLRKRTEADSLAEVIRRALAVYEYLWAEREKGRQVVVKDSRKREREVVLL